MYAPPTAIWIGVHRPVPVSELLVFANRRTRQKNFPVPSTTILRSVGIAVSRRRAVESAFGTSHGHHANPKRAVRSHAHSDPHSPTDFFPPRSWSSVAQPAIF